MKVNWLLALLVFCYGVFSNGAGRATPSRPAVVNIGAIITLNSTIGKVAKIAIDLAVKDVNSDPSVLGGTKLQVKIHGSNCSGLLGMVKDSWAPLSWDVTEKIQGVLALRLHTVDSARKRAFVSRWSNLTSNMRRSSLVGLNAYGFYAYDTVWMVAHAIHKFFNEGGTISFSNYSRLHDEKGRNLHLEAMTIFNGGQHLLNNILQTNLVGLCGLLQFNPSSTLMLLLETLQLSQTEQRLWISHNHLSSLGLSLWLPLRRSTQVHGLSFGHLLYRCGLSQQQSPLPLEQLCGF